MDVGSETYSSLTESGDSEITGMGLALSPLDRNLLNHERNNHAVSLSCTFKWDQHHRLIPSVTYFKENCDGDAISNDAVMEVAFHVPQ